MSASERQKVSPVPATLESPQEWPETAARIASLAGVPTTVTPEMLGEMIGSAVALLYAADGSRDMGLLRGTFADPVIAQCERNAGGLQGERPTSAVIRLVGVRTVDAHPTLRVHLSIGVTGGTQTVSGQVWDIEVGGDATVGRPDCPNCGAPLPAGGLTCGHCGSDVRTVVNVPLLVSRLELY